MGVIRDRRRWNPGRHGCHVPAAVPTPCGPRRMPSLERPPRRRGRGNARRRRGVARRIMLATGDHGQGEREDHRQPGEASGTSIAFRGATRQGSPEQGADSIEHEDDTRDEEGRAVACRLRPGDEQDANHEGEGGQDGMSTDSVHAPRPPRGAADRGSLRRARYRCIPTTARLCISPPRKDRGQIAPGPNTSCCAACPGTMSPIRPPAG